MTDAQENAGQNAGPAVETAAPAPATQTTSADAGTEEFVRVPRSQLEPYGGDYHEALRRANEHDRLGREMNMTPAEILTAWNAQGEQDVDPAAGEADTPAYAPANAPMTQASFEAAMKERDERDATARSEAADIQARQDAQVAMDTSARTALTEIGFKPNEDGTEKPGFDVAYTQYYVQLDRIRQNTVPAYYTPDQRAQMLAGAPTQEQLAQATQATKDAMKGYHDAIIGGFAEDQSDVPDATLAGGAGGTVSTADPSGMTDYEFDHMNADDRRAHEARVLAAVEQRRAQGG